MSTLIDTELILSENEQWKKLEEEWKPIDLEMDDDDTPTLKPVYSTLDLKGTTFDSSFLFKKVTRKIGRQLSKKSTASHLEYNDFISHLKGDPDRESSQEFYYINGQIISAHSIENICDTIDDIFKSIDRLSTVTSTAKKFPETVQCSISATDLSFDDTEDLAEDTRYSEIERHIEEAFEEFSSVPDLDSIDQSTLDSVTTLVRKFSSVLNDPVQCSPRRRRQCCEKFKELADFWKNRAFECDK